MTADLFFMVLSVFDAQLECGLKFSEVLKAFVLMEAELPICPGCDGEDPCGGCHNS